MNEEIRVWALGRPRSSPPGGTSFLASRQHR